MLVIDETGDRKDGTNTDHVGYQYLGSIGRIANGIVSVSSVWADGRIYHPLDVEPYTPAKRLKKGRSDPAFRTKPQIAVELEARPSSVHTFRAVVADCLYGEKRGLRRGDVQGEGALRPEPETPQGEVGRRGSGAHPGRSRREDGLELRGGSEVEAHRQDLQGRSSRGMVGGGGHHAHQLRSEQTVRLVAVSTDPETLPANSSWYLVTNLPARATPRQKDLR